MDRGQSEALLEVAELAAVGSSHPADGLGRHRHRGVAGVDAAGGRERVAARSRLDAFG